MVYAMADERRRTPGVAILYGALAWDCLRHGQVYWAPDKKGAACWLPPGTSATSLPRQIAGGMLRLPLHFGWRGFRRLTAYDEVAQALHKKNAPQPHWYLSVLAVEPANQGQGVGSALMQPMLKRADAEGLSCYLDTHEDRNVRLYQRYGFEVATCAQPPGHAIPVFSMVRPPRRD